ncbi:MAG: hypothetical protein AAFN80_05095 [Pseudomonadota bacterium]
MRLGQASRKVAGQKTFVGDNFWSGVYDQAVNLQHSFGGWRVSGQSGQSGQFNNVFECPVWMAPALQEFFVIAMVCQYSRVSGLFAWQLPLALMSSASKVPIG